MYRKSFMLVAGVCCLMLGWWIGWQVIHASMLWIGITLSCCALWVVYITIRYGRLPPQTHRGGFTLVELLVAITIVAILAATTMAVTRSAIEAAKAEQTKATIAKLNGIIMERYESYLTRRVGFDVTGMTGAQVQAADQAARANPNVAARYRLDAIRDTMRMEMPDCLSDITNLPVQFSWGHVPESGLHKLYAKQPPSANLDPAQALYLTVALGSVSAMEQFNQQELGMVDGHRVFVDGWGKPIMWIRWAPGYRSPVQSGDPMADHDPLDARWIETSAFHLIPLIYSSGGNKTYGINLVAGYQFSGDPYANLQLGAFMPGVGGEGCITNHQIEQR